MNALSQCPHCGADLAESVAPQIKGLDLSLFADSFWQGKALHLSPSERSILTALVKQPGTFIRSEALENITDSKAAETGGNCVQVFICRIRTKFKEIDPAFDLIESEIGRNARGYRWRVCS